MNTDNVIQMADRPPPPPAPIFPPPDGFKSRQKIAWDDLVQGTPSALHVPAMRFTFEFAATLLARFRSGRTMSATESKELRHYLTALGIRSEFDDPSKKKSNTLHKYIRP